MWLHMHLQIGTDIRGPLGSDLTTHLQHQHTNTHNWLPEGEILGLHIVLTLEEASPCYTRIRSRVDDAAEVRCVSRLF